MDRIRVGIVGLGANTRLRHVPGLRACTDVQITGVCNRSSESTSAAAREYDVPKTYSRWEELVADPDIDAVVIGTWPYLHCAITLAALDAGKHVLTEARMAMNAAEARQMLQASQSHSGIVTQIVPSPFGLRAGLLVKELVAEGFLGELREVVVLGTNNSVADSNSPLHWRQATEYSGQNMLVLGILHETLIRWAADPVRVLSQTHVFTPRRIDPAKNELADVGTPDAVRVLTELPCGARGLYHLSGVMHHGPGIQIHLYGSDGTIKYHFTPEDRLFAARKDDKELTEISVPSDKAGHWRVEEEFINSIRGEEKVELTDFATGVRYMEFTESVARSAESGQWVELSSDS